MTGSEAGGRSTTHSAAAPEARLSRNRSGQLTDSITLCQSRLPDQEWIVADMRGLSLARRFEGILAWDSFFHLGHDHQRAMFGLFAAHAATGVILMFNAGPTHGEAIGSYRGDPLFHAGLHADQSRRLLFGNNFDPVDHAVEDQSAGGRTVWVARAAEG